MSSPTYTIRCTAILQNQEKADGDYMARGVGLLLERIPRSTKGMIGRWIEKASANLPDHIIANSDNTRSDLKTKLNIKSEKITVARPQYLLIYQERQYQIKREI